MEAFAEATGLLARIREFTGWVADFVRYHRAPHQARLLMRAAEKIKDCGLPALAVEDKLLQKILRRARWRTIPRCRSGGSIC